MKKLSVLLLLLLTLGLLCGCAAGGAPSDGMTHIALSDTGIQIRGGGAKAAGSTVTVSAVGTYVLSGSLSDGQVLVDTGDDTLDVTLILDGADITCLSGPAIHIRQAKNTRLQLAEGSVNRLCSGAEGSAQDPEASGAALYAEDDLDIDGPGSLEVLGYINNGIACKDDLDINGGSISVTAVNNGVRGSESVELKGGELAVEAGNDGIKATEADKEGKGYITVSGGSVAVTAGGDGLSAETALTLEGGAVTVAATGDPLQVSSKAVKAGTTLTVSGGTLAASSGDHAVHSAGDLVVTGGEITASSSAGKALAAHGDITVSGGSLSLDALEDGVETPGNIAVSGGSLTVTAGDDALQSGEANTGKGDVAVSGGEVKISAKGRSINARGQLFVTGGSLIALGNSDKVAIPAAGGQPCIHVGKAGTAGQTLTLLTESGEALISLTAAYPYHVILLSAPGLEAGAAYSLSQDGALIPVQAG